MPRLPTVKILWENSLVKNVSSYVTISIIQTDKKKKVKTFLINWIMILKKQQNKDEILKMV